MNFFCSRSISGLRLNYVRIKKIKKEGVTKKIQILF